MSGTPISTTSAPNLLDCMSQCDQMEPCVTFSYPRDTSQKCYMYGTDKNTGYTDPNVDSAYLDDATRSVSGRVYFFYLYMLDFGFC